MQTIRRLSHTEWLNYEELAAMLPRVRGKATARQLRLFPCACARRAWHLLLDPRSREAVEVVEKFADGRASQEQVTAANRTASAAIYAPLPKGWNTAAQKAACEAANAANSCAHG